MKLPHYKVLFEHGVYNIPQRLKEYDESFFVVYNTKSKKFEVHSTDNLFSTYCFTVPFNELDSRTIDLVKKNDTKNKGPQDIEREINRHNEKIEEKKDKDFKNWIEDVAKETHSAFKKDLDNEYIGVSRKGLYNDYKKDIRTR